MSIFLEGCWIMGDYARGGNVRGSKVGQVFTTAVSTPATPPSRWRRIVDAVEEYAFVVVLPVAIMATVLSFVFLILVAIGLQQVFGLQVAASATHFSAHVTETYNWPDVVDTLSWFWLGCTIASALAWIVFALAVMEDWGQFVIHMLALLGLAAIGIGVLGAVAHVDHGVDQPYAKMQDKMNNWVVNTLHVPGEIDITDETTFTRDYLRYDAQHKPVYFTIKSTKNTVTVNLTER